MLDSLVNGSNLTESQIWVYSSDLHSSLARLMPSLGCATIFSKQTCFDMRVAIGQLLTMVFDPNCASESPEEL